MPQHNDLQDKMRRRRSSGKVAQARKAAAKRRARPTARAQARSAQRRQNPLPPPPARRPLRAARPAAATAPAGLIDGVEPSERVRQLQQQFADLEAKGQLSPIYDAIGGFEERLVEFPLALEALRDRGYVHSGYLEDTIEALDDKWDEVRPRVEAALRSQVRRLDRELEQSERQVDRLRPNAASIRQVEPAVNALSQRINAAQAAVAGLYDGLSAELDKTGWTLSRLAQMMSLIEASENIKLLEGEGPLRAIKAEWHQDGDEGPEGVLILTDQHLFFEQREEVVTKRRLGIFKAESEMIQELHIAVQISEIEEVKASEEGGFLGMGKDDILELVLAATAPVSRARFHLDGENSADWAILIKKAQSGEIDEDRADEYEDDLADLEAQAMAFPTACPNCFAAVPPPARGVASVTCEFCGTIITPQPPAATE